VIPTTVADTENKIYLGSVPLNLTEIQVHARVDGCVYGMVCMCMCIYQAAESDWLLGGARVCLRVCVCVCLMWRPIPPHPIPGARAGGRVRGPQGLQPRQGRQQRRVQGAAGVCVGGAARVCVWSRRLRVPITLCLPTEYVCACVGVYVCVCVYVCMW
jgi:hypothetical protein